MGSLSTAPDLKDFNTVATGQLDTKNRNHKVIGFRNTTIQGNKDSSMSSHWRTIEDYLFYDVSSFWGKWIPQKYLWTLCTTAVVLEKDLEELISTYKCENVVHNLNINELFVSEYKPHASINLLHSFTDIGKEIFKDARQRNELEEKIINDFVRSKTKVLSSKVL